ADDAPLRGDGFDDVVQDFIDGVLIEDAEVAVSQEIHFERFQLDAAFARHVADGDCAVVGKASFGADGSIFGKVRGDDVAGKLVGPGVEPRQPGVDASTSVFIGVSGQGALLESIYCTVTRGWHRVAARGTIVPRTRLV